MITEKAANEIKRISDDEGIGHYSVRVKLSGGGCSGMTQNMDFDNNPLETDEIIEMDGIRILIDHISAQYMSEATLDYKSGLLGAGFVFLDPQVKTTCGCGKSVGY